MSEGTQHSRDPVATGNAPAQIGKYRIVRQIAQGGMAEIYLATSTGIEGFEKLCVLKRILPLLAGNNEFLQMFLDEARIAASLLHSNIAQVFDIGEDKGSYYFVMEFLRGEDVRHILQSSVKNKQFVPYEHVVTIINGTCAGLHYAHEVRGKDGKPLQIVHRDISPQNIFVTHDGSVKLCDFGIAKSATQLTETRVGTLKGKIRYMSPEQCQSEPLDRRSDVFALSIVLWELVCLRRLFSGKSDFEIFKAIVEEPLPKPSIHRSDVPDGLEQIIMKGLARKREDRFQSAQDMQIALEDWARAERVRTSPVRLAQFMADLFPAIASDSYLSKITEVDPLADRIKFLNENESSDSGLVNGEERTTAAKGTRGPDVSSPSHADAMRVPPKSNRTATVALILSSLLLVAAVTVWALRPGRPGPVADTTIIVPKTATAAKPNEPVKPASGTDALHVPSVPTSITVPATPVQPVDPVATAPQSQPTTSAQKARSATRKAKRPATPSTASKKASGANDDLLPP